MARNNTGTARGGLSPEHVREIEGTYGPGHPTPFWEAIERYQLAISRQRHRVVPYNELARLLGVARQSILAWRNGVRPKPELVLRVARQIDMDPRELLELAGYVPEDVMRPYPRDPWEYVSLALGTAPGIPDQVRASMLAYNRAMKAAHDAATAPPPFRLLDDADAAVELRRAEVERERRATAG